MKREMSWRYAITSRSLSDTNRRLRWTLGMKASRQSLAGLGRRIYPTIIEEYKVNVGGDVRELLENDTARY